MIKSQEHNTIGCILKLRYKMGRRFLQELGWWRSVLVGGMMLFFGFGLVAGWHRQRKDSSFIQSLGISPPHLYVCEYLMAALPAIIMLVFTGIWPGVLLLMMGCFALAWVPVSSKSTYMNASALSLPVSLSYEWVSGLRIYKWTLGILFVSGLILIWFNLFAGWICVFFMTGTVCLFYQYCEPVSFILETGKTPAILILQKIAQSAVCYGLLTGILWCTMMLFHPENMLYSLLFLLANLVLLFTVIVGKYAFYEENMQITLMVNIIFFFSSMCLVVPFLPPVLGLLCIWLWVKAMKKLNREVYAFH